ncbi:PAS domain S-box protein [Hymenobacter sp. UV11]|uniref:PAS domain S-box protein n=1 Tax=Hymenobacter sp. UV11 TaxID=1849735 RepID=UPI00105D292D|nr:PAS domain S-box protein [Hymenobacter sp. UV11]TFZ65515.1 PAS domain S-box protein [Hymenobacter sp. UV11]
MVSKTTPSAVAWRHALRRRDAEIARLRERLAAAEAPVAGPLVGISNFLTQLPGLFAGVITTDAQGRLTWANTSFLARCGCALAELQGQYLGSLPGQPVLSEASQRLLTHGLAGGTSFQFDLAAPCSSHAGSWLRVHLQPVCAASPSECTFIGLLEDIFQEKCDQLALAESEKRYRELAEQVPGVLYRWRKNLDGTFTSLFACAKMHELFGVTPGDAGSLYRLIHPDDQARWLESVAEATAEGSTAPWRFEGRLVVPGRPLIWWRGDSVLSYRDAHGAVYSGIIRDITSQKQAEEAARHSQLRQHLAVDGLGDGSWEFDCRTLSSVLSPEFWTLIGYDPVEQQGKDFNWDAYTHPDDLAMVGRHWEEYQAGHTAVFSAEHRLRCRNGSYKWVLNRGLITQRDELGQPVLVTGVSIDISASKKAAAELAAAALRLSTTIASLQRGIVLVDEHDRIVLVNDFFCQIFGLTTLPEQLVGMKHADLAQQAKGFFEDEEAFLEFAEKAVRENKVINNYIVTLRDGRVLERSFVPIRDGDTDIGQLWQFKEITERYYAQQTLKRQEEKYRNIINNMQLGLVEMDLDNRVLHANESYCQMIGYPAAELLHQPLHPLIVGLADETVMADKLTERRRGISGSYELEITTKQGERKWLFIGAAPLYGDDKQVYGTIGINLDITRQKQLENSLREAKQLAEDSAKVKELFLANMSHEIRTPMNAILGMSQLLAKTTLAPRQRNYLHAITTSAQNLLVIINDILDLSKLDAGKMTIEQVGFNVDRLCEQVAKTMLYKVEEKGLHFETWVSPLVPNVVLGDPYRITQVLLNLASNSVKFTEKGTIRVECDVAGYINGQVIVAFSVSDTGIGIDPAYLHNIFQEFSQEDPSITRKFGGTGLGLSISRSLVRLMGGELNIESEKHQGTSTHFCLFLPVGTVHDLPQRKSVAITNSQELRGKHVLLVEDNKYNRLLAKTFLHNAHIEVTEAEHGAEAIACVGKQKFDLILMDVQMPVMDGFQATRYLRQELGLTTPIIALTASAINGEKEKCLAAGMNDYLTKPFYEDELLQLVHDWVLRPQPSTTTAAEAPPALLPGASPALYKLDILLNTARGNQKFVLSMLQTFIDSTYNALRDLDRDLEVGDVAGLQATAHKLRPSLMHLQIQAAVALMDSLENWEGPFSYDDLQPLVESSDLLLRQVLADMSAELETLRRDEVPAVVSK